MVPLALLSRAQSADGHVTAQSEPSALAGEAGLAERSVVMEELEKLLNDLARPIWVWRAGRAMTSSKHPGQARGAETRRVHALAEIQKMLDDYHEGRK